MPKAGFEPARVFPTTPSRCYLYHLIADDPGVKTHYDALKKAKQWGFKISQHTVKVNNLDGVFEYIKEWNTERRKLPYDTDGVVIKVNSRATYHDYWLGAFPHDKK